VFETFGNEMKQKEEKVIRKVVKEGVKRVVKVEVKHFVLDNTNDY